MQTSFQTKLILTYSFFIIILLFVLGISFYMYNAFLFQKSAEDSLSQLVLKTSQQLDNCIREMDNVAVEITSYTDVLNALTDITISQKSFMKDYDMIKCSDIIQKTLLIKSISQSEIFRASIFNKEGYFISNGAYDEHSDSVVDRVKRLSWLEEVRQRQGGKYLVPPHKDDWVSNDWVSISNTEVFSLVRVIRDPGNEIGFIEIQQSAQNLKQICDVKGNNKINTLVIDDFGHLIYSNSNIDKSFIDFYRNAIPSGTDKTISAVPPYSKTRDIISFHHSDYTGWNVLIIQNEKDLLAPLVFIRNITFFIGLGIVLISLLFIYIFSRQLTRPLRNLKETMELVRIENLPDTIPLRHENNEIQALNKAFQKMRKRLNEAIEHELKSHSLHMKAHFDALQAQINPHFLHNMLGVLANMGDEAGQNKISNTCQSLSRMLRYSTSAKEVMATIGEEIDHTVNYLSLMKRRFEHRLEYSINVDTTILEIDVPKLIIQPLVENSIAHGFDNCADTMKITVNGGIIEGAWQISIIDNGSGFNSETLENLNQKINCYSESLLTTQQNLELSIGGMGLISTFARLFLLFGENLRFELRNNEDGGACINIGGSLPNKDSKEENTNV